MNYESSTEACEGNELVDGVFLYLTNWGSSFGCQNWTGTGGQAPCSTVLAANYRCFVRANSWHEKDTNIQCIGYGSFMHKFCLHVH